MNNQLAIKTYKIDYEFIIKNYLDKSLWKKIWNLFIFKDNIFTLSLESINTRSERIYFEISFNKLNNQWHVCKSKQVVYDLNNMSIEMLKKEINGAIFELSERLDVLNIVMSDEYREIESTATEEEERLREIAEEFLDENDVTNSDIRDAYVDKFVDENKKIDDKLEDYKNLLKYNFQTELLLVICELIKDDLRKNKVIANLRNQEKLIEVQKEISEYVDYMNTSDWNIDATDNLIAI